MPLHHRGAWQKIPVESRGVLFGWEEIGKYLGVSIPTATKYMQVYGLPVVKNDVDVWMIPKSLVDTWFKAISKMQRKERAGKKPRGAQSRISKVL